MAEIKIRWSINAVKNLEQIADYISQNSPLYAPVFIQKIIDSTDKLVLFPEAGRVVPEYDNQFIRELLFHNYRIIYRINGNQIDISDVFHSTRIIDISNR